MIWEICSRTSQELGLYLLSFFDTLLRAVSLRIWFNLEIKSSDQILSILWLSQLLKPAEAT